MHDLLDDPSALAHVIRSCRPDVACLQEVPRRPLSRRRVQRLARETGLRWSAGGVGSGGTAVFTSRRVDVLSAAVVRLPVAGLVTRTRGYALAQVRLPGGPPVTVVSVHLPLRPAERLRHVDLVMGRLGRLELPYLVAGDLNEPPSGPAWATFGPLLRDAAVLRPETYEPTYPAAAAGEPTYPAAEADEPTYPAAAAGEPTYPSGAPNRRIDAVLLSPGIGVERLMVAGAAEHLSAEDLSAASDHLPLIADLALSS